MAMRQECRVYYSEFKEFMLTPTLHMVSAKSSAGMCPVLGWSVDFGISSRLPVREVGESRQNSKYSAWGMLV